ncbi:MAG: TylF/MycF/NovP-related O-methyltransferase [Candidatus Hodarchaeota archaeon]
MKFEDLYRAVASYTMLDAERIQSLWTLVNDINIRKIGGDIVECGCSKGGSSAVLRAGMGSQRKLWIYDSFEGMPETSAQDGDEARKWVGRCGGSIDDVLTILEVTGAVREEVVIRKGWFKDTFTQELPEKVALLHCDADWYESVTLVLQTFYPLMPEGACLILDDFGYWEGCRLAFYDFCGKHGERPLLERVGTTQAYWIKGKEHNRNG